MAYLDETIPADSEAVTLGASRIRELKVDLDALISQMFSDNGTFLAGWIKAAAGAGGASLFAPQSIQTADIASGAITAALIAAQTITAGQITPGTITAALLAAGFVAPGASVATSSIQPKAVGSGQMGDGSVGPTQLAPGLVKGAAIGTYAGTSSGSTAVSLTFAPTVVIIVDQTYQGIGIAFNVENPGGNCEIHESWDSSTTPISSSHQNYVQFGGAGFTIITGATHFNYNGHTYTYVALSI